MDKRMNPADKEADRYRICPNPKCSKQHYVEHRGKDYCSKKCADAHYNQKRRLDKHAEALIEDDSKKTELLTYSSPTLDSSITNISPFGWQKILDGNVSILDLMPIDEEKGAEYPTKYLEDKGYRFDIYSKREPLYNIPKKMEAYYAIIGKYRMYRTQPDKVFIYKQY
jgi:hypothetical protein